MSRDEDDTQPFVREALSSGEEQPAKLLSDEDYPSHPRDRRAMDRKPGLWRRFCTWLTGGPWPEPIDPSTDEEGAMEAARLLSEGAWQEPNEFVRHEGPKHSVQPVPGVVDMERVAREIATLRSGLEAEQQVSAELRCQLDDYQLMIRDLQDELAVAKRLLKATKKKKPSGKRTRK